MVDWEEFERICQACTKCDLYKTRNKLVFGKGNLNADLMIISEAPGAQEDQTGVPFVGKSGQLLDKILAAVDISRDEIYLANILKCHPPGNRSPLESEKQACLPYLRYQVQLIHPKIIVCLGRVASQAIIKPDLRITREHGSLFYRKGYCMIPTYHPSALLRDPSKKRDSWEDFKIIKAKYEEVKKL